VSVNLTTEFYAFVALVVAVLLSVTLPSRGYAAAVAHAAELERAATNIL
jgi:hypothetical protein